MVACTPCMGFGVRHFQYILFALLITIEFWMQEITMKTFFRNIAEPGESHKGGGKVTLHQLTQIQEVTYFCFALGRFSSGFACLRVNNKYLLITFVVFEVVVATGCYWYIIYLSFFSLMAISSSIGFTRAFHWTLVMNMLSKWMPPNDFTTGNTIIVVTREFFTLMIKFFTNSTTFETSRNILLGVMAVYVTWTFVFLVLGAEGPESSFLLSKTEHAHLAKHIGPRKKTRCSSKIPFKSIFGTIFLYGWLIADLGRECSVTMISDGFHLGLRDIKAAPVAVIQVCTGFFYAVILVCSVLSDKLITKEVLTPGQVRKIYSSVGCCGASISMILAAYSVRASPKFGFLITGQVFAALMALGQPLALFDISPNYAGFMFAIFTFIRCLLYAARLIFDSMTGYFPLTEANFDNNFYRYGFIVFMTNLIFLLFGDIEKKPFDAYDTADWTKDSYISYP